MAPNVLSTVLALVLVVARADATSPPKGLPRVNVDSQMASISGVSSGAYMSVQTHLSFSSHFMGIGALAGGPFFCAGLPPASIAVAQTACMNTPSLIDVSLLIQETKNAADIRSLDELSHLAGQRVWVFAGSKDTKVVPGVGSKLVDYYTRLMNEACGSVSSCPSDWLKTHIGDLPAEHAWITLNEGNDCGALGEPYISHCNFDASGDMLQHIYGPLTQPESMDSCDWLKKGSLSFFDQSIYLPTGWAVATASIAKSGLIFVPTGCEASADGQPQGPPCKVHFSLHGCEQTMDDIGEQFVLNTGIGAWAAANRIVVVFPQARKSTVVPFNPKGCWDWWGYTGADYSSKLAPQTRLMYNILEALLTPNGVNNATITV